MDATFWNKLDIVPEGTRITVSAEVRLKGPYKVSEWLPHGYVRSRVRRHVVKPLKAAAERY